MRAFFFSILGYFLSPLGLVLMGVLDASMVFFLPLGIDFVVIIMAARRPELFWLYALLATLGSVAGAAGTFWVGHQVGEKGLTRFVSPRRLKRVKARVDRGVFVVAGAGPDSSAVSLHALRARERRVRHESQGVLQRAGSSSACFASGSKPALASRYGRGILRWMRTPTFQMVVAGFIVLAAIGTIVSAVVLIRSSKRAASPAA